MKKEIPVFFTIDESYAPPLAVALNSAIKKSNPERQYRAIILYQDLTQKTMDRLQSLEKENFAIEFIPMKSEFESITDSMSNRLRCDYFTLTIYFRLFIPKMFPQYEKGIYIDSDIVLNRDIAELYDIDLKDNYIGACPDLSIAGAQPLVDYTINSVGMDKGEYINSGVLLMDLKKLRELNFDEHFLELLNRYHFDSIAPDQDYINAMCNKKILYLNCEWDAMPDENEPLSDPALIHYNLFSKPWCYDDIPYGEYFWENAETSGYIEELKEYKANYSDEQKKSDSECMGLLVSRATEILEKGKTFKEEIENGVKIRL